MKIVVIIDGFNISFTALEKGIQIAKKENCPIKVAVVLRESDLSRYKRNSKLWRAVDGSIIEPRDVKLSDEMVIFKIEREINAYLMQTDIEDIEYEIEVSIGEPYETVSHAAHDGEINLIVMGKSGQSNIKRFFMGSVAPIYASDANCPILVVQAEYFNEYRA